jgi:hypothetical protein
MRGGEAVEHGPTDARDWLYIGPDPEVCERGHELTPENTYERPDRSTPRCRTCTRETQRELMRRRRNAA